MQKSRNPKQHYGIGLYMADVVIKQHGGELVPGNSARTGGAEVLVKLPLNITAYPSGPLPTQNNFQLY